MHRTILRFSSSMGKTAFEACALREARRLKLPRATAGRQESFLSFSLSLSLSLRVCVCARARLSLSAISLLCALFGLFDLRGVEGRVRRGRYHKRAAAAVSRRNSILDVLFYGAWAQCVACVMPYACAVCSEYRQKQK